MQGQMQSGLAGQLPQPQQRLPRRRLPRVALVKAAAAAHHAALERNVHSPPLELHREGESGRKAGQSKTGDVLAGCAGQRRQTGRPAWQGQGQPTDTLRPRGRTAEMWRPP